MANVTLPLLLKEFTGGARRADVSGASVAEILHGLGRLYPGLEGRIQRDGKLDPNLLVAVDGAIAAEGLSTPVRPDSQVSILPTFGGG